MKFIQFISIFIVILLISAIVSCESVSDKKTSPQPTELELLQGDWVTEKYNHGFFIRQFHINVYDSILTFFSDYSDSVHFSIEGKFLTIFDSTNTYQLGTNQKYKIEKISNEELILIAKSYRVRNRLRDYSWESDTLEFRKVVKKNDLKPMKIGFSSSGCFGMCPSIKLEIDDEFNLKFYGGMFSNVEGPYRGKIDPEIYNSIVHQIQQIPIDSLKPRHYATWTDDQTRFLVIQTEDMIIRTEVYGKKSEPVELTILLDNLMDLYRRSDLKMDSSINHDKSFDKFLKMSFPMEILPPPEEPKTQ